MYPPLSNDFGFVEAFLKLVGVCILKISPKCTSSPQELAYQEIRLVIPKLQVDAAKGFCLYHQLVTPATGHIRHLWLWTPTSVPWCTGWDWHRAESGGGSGGVA